MEIQENPHRTLTIYIEHPLSSGIIDNLVFICIFNKIAQKILQKITKNMQLSSDQISLIQSNGVPAGIHIVSNCYDCDLSGLENDGIDGFERFLSKIIEANGLTEVGKCYYSFGGIAFTATVVLAESHVSVHTWPEIGFVSIDVYVCNVSRDNTESAKQLYKELERYFNPATTKNETILR